jgi:hypothetical protein
VSAVEQKKSRVLSGSRRRRDLAAVGLTDQANRESEKRAAEALAQREREARLRPQVQSSPSADSAWASVCEALRISVPESTFALWLEPLTCIGEVSGALAVEAPEHTFAWTACRYGALLGRHARDASEHRGVFLFRARPPSRTEDDGLL